MLLLENARQDFSCLISKGRLVMRTSLQVGLDAGARIMASTVAKPRSSGLQSSGLPYEEQSVIQDLSFEGSSVFSD